jgi:hypothetical protein
MNLLKNNSSIDDLNSLRKFLKYIIMFCVLCSSSYYIPINKLDISESFMIAVAGVCSFAILDLYSPIVCDLNNNNKHKIGVK